jgi:hypothetical protein
MVVLPVDLGPAQPSCIRSGEVFLPLSRAEVGDVEDCLTNDWSTEPPAAPSCLPTTSQALTATAGFGWATARMAQLTSFTWDCLRPLLLADLCTLCAARLYERFEATGRRVRLLT